MLEVISIYILHFAILVRVHITWQLVGCVIDSICPCPGFCHDYNFCVFEHYLSTMNSRMIMYTWELVLKYVIYFFPRSFSFPQWLGCLMLWRIICAGNSTGISAWTDIHLVVIVDPLLTSLTNRVLLFLYFCSGNFICYLWLVISH